MGDVQLVSRLCDQLSPGQGLGPLSGEGQKAVLMLLFPRRAQSSLLELQI